MDYEKKYNESMAKMAAFLKKHDGLTISSDGEIYKELQGIFSELTESEDEKIRKEITEFIYKNADRGEELEKRKNWLAYLEKQGEQKVIIPKFRVGDTIHIKNSSAEYIITDISNGMYHGKGWGLDIVAADNSGDWELVEQKPVEWSEEDLSMLGNIRSIIEKYAISQSAVDVSGELCEKEYIDADKWLKSLKNRYTPQSHWKPSEDQMIALKEATDEHWEPDGLDPLYTLYQDLKKLREE